MMFFLSVQCTDDEEEEPIVPQQDVCRTADHTLLVYIAGENSLSGYADPNIRLMEQGLLKADSALHLIIFEDNQKLSKSLLFRVDRHDETLDTVQIATFDEDLDSADPEVMKQVVQLAFADSPASIKGLVLWSHAMSWIPSTNFQTPSRAEDGPNRMPAYFGQDNTDYMELWELREALEAGPHLDYILVDACFFSMAEVAYELRGVTDYMMAAPTEVFGAGYPYQNVIPLLTQMNASNREEKLTEAAKAFQAEYGTNGTLSLLRTAGTESLMEQWRASRAKYPEVWAAMEMSPTTWFTRLQHFGRRRVGALYYFYDFADVLDQVAAEAGDSTYQTDVSATVAYEFHSSVFTDYSEELRIRTCCGLGVSIPELFQLATNCDRMTAGYPMTQWGRDAAN
jgi:hypothetical protein